MLNWANVQESMMAIPKFLVRKLAGLSILAGWCAFLWLWYKKEQSAHGIR